MTEQKKAVFIARGKGQSFEDFKKSCIESFRAAGLLKEKDKTVQNKDAAKRDDITATKKKDE